VRHQQVSVSERTSQLSTSIDIQALDNPVWAALTGRHAHLAQRHGQAACYPADVSPFAALADERSEDAWADLARLVGPGVPVLLAGDGTAPPPGWEVTGRVPGVQLVGSTVDGVDEPQTQRLTPDAVPEMLDLVARTRPGPFAPRTIEMGSYLGIRRHGRLMAMAGERLNAPGFTEISAVCTDPTHRGEGLATRLILAVVAGIRARGDAPFLHAAANNTNAVRLYQTLGFQLRRPITFQGVCLGPDGRRAGRPQV
jgi:ribosomal protein S18 acetylase RimI-like enzyme